MLPRILLASAIFAAISVLACGSDSDGTRAVTGLVTAVDAPSLTQLDGFSFRTDDGRALGFRIAPEANRQDPQRGFVPGHLREHALTSTKVKITYREEGNELLAVRIEDVLT